ncbi:hypothetical protein PoMZ_11984 [Pyricularia oryzae]|uniref:Uncharacterized protein n=1 Tax=Pyricularia oryzae TaxID=318829 RepID=A0A4P7NLM2_PYROR|nr:hypothetical protein PoMZ_11984 [Pyricularia oryzae]
MKTSLDQLNLSSHYINTSQTRAKGYKLASRREFLTSGLPDLPCNSAHPRFIYKFPDLHNPPNLWRRTSEDAKPPVVHVAAPFCT